MRLRDPQFEGQTKGKLGNVSVRSMVQKATYEKLGEWFEEHPKEANVVATKVINAQRARVEAKKTRDLIAAAEHWKRWALLNPMARLFWV